MSRNESDLDRALRAFVVAPLAIVLAIVVGASTVGGLVLLAVAAIMVITAAIGFCPLYALFHINTCPRRTVR